MCDYFLCAPYWGPGPQPRHVPWLGIQPAMLWFAGRHSTTEPHQPWLNSTVLQLAFELRSSLSPHTVFAYYVCLVSQSTIVPSLFPAPYFLCDIDLLKKKEKSIICNVKCPILAFLWGHLTYPCILHSFYRLENNSKNLIGLKLIISSVHCRSGSACFILHHISYRLFHFWWN